ncbi:MAG TPA: hypothetical protein VNA04_16530, partial [Thermoanaerobaculia bacterium]|nr:hypothetical protein [Thermoanaerobaculia bacterium]
EGDVSMNKGVGAAIGVCLSIGNYNSAVTHEVGHTLGFRHADKSRDNNQACTNFASYDCATSAIMTAIVTNGLAGALAAWDQRAVSALYPSVALAAPTGVVAAATGSTSVAVSWTGVDGASTYEVHRSAANDFASFSGTPVCTSSHPTVTCTDTTASANQAYLYKVRAGSGGTFSATDLATTVVFTDPTLTVGTTMVKAAHLTELRTAAAAMRTLAKISAFTFTDSVLNSSVAVKRIHLIDLRDAINQARSTMSLSAASYTDSTITAGSTIIKAVHINDLRNAVK